MIQGAAGNLIRCLRALPRGDYFTDGRFLFVLLPAYFAAFIWIVFIPADFWDDLSFRNNPDPIRFGFQAGSPLLGYFWVAQLGVPYHDIVVRLLVLVAFVVIALILRSLLSLFHFADERTRNAIALVTATLPVFQSRFLQAIFLGTITLLFFAMAVHLLIQSLRQNRPWKRFVAYLLFAFSFAAPSFLVLYGFVILLVVVCQAARPRAMCSFTLPGWFEEVQRLVFRAPDTLILPFAYFLLKMWLVPVSGPFAAVEYQSITLRALTAALVSTPLDALNALLAFHGDGTPVTLLFLVAIVVGILVVLLQGVRSPLSLAWVAQSRDWRPLVIAYLGVMMSVFPYVVVNRTVGPFDFDDRNQLTLVLTAGTFIVLAIRFFLHERLQWIAILCVITWGVANNIATYNAVIVDGHTQNAVVRELANNEAVRNGSAFVVDTSQWPALSRRRVVGTAQLNCLLKDAFGDERRFAAQLSARPLDWNQQLKLLTVFAEAGTCFSEFKGGSPQLITILPGSRTIENGIELSVLRLFSPARYRAGLDGLVQVIVTTVPPGLLVNSLESTFPRSQP